MKSGPSASRCVEAGRYDHKSQDDREAVSDDFTPPCCVNPGRVRGGSGMVALQEVGWLAPVQKHLHRLVRYGSHLWTHQCCDHGALHIRCALSPDWLPASTVFGLTDWWTEGPFYIKRFVKWTIEDLVVPYWPDVCHPLYPFVYLYKKDTLWFFFQFWLEKQLYVCIFGCNKKTYLIL